MSGEEEEEVDELQNDEDEDIPLQSLVRSSYAHLTSGPSDSSLSRQKARETSVQEDDIEFVAHTQNGASGSSRHREKARETAQEDELDPLPFPSGAGRSDAQEHTYDSSQRREEVIETSAQEDELESVPFPSGAGLSDARARTSGLSQVRERGRETPTQEDEVETLLLPPESADAPGPSRQAISSPSLAKLLHPENPSRSPTPSSVPIASGSNVNPKPEKLSRSPSPIIISSPTEFTVASGSKLQRSLPSPPPSPPRVEPEPLSAYSCPICFFPRPTRP
ncbi:hypothetical protein B0H19DRAFT_1261813 [Mycena capillaripes]|nr:hypothetical protein B0H19DRAFT_1261813 [Mycena capillaripes]